MMTVKGGEFWIATILFTDGKASKKRPVLVLWTDGDDVVLAAVTSAKPRSSKDFLLNDWAEAGLRVASTVRLSRLDCLEKSLLTTKLGKLSKKDATNLLKVWKTQIVPEF